MPSRSTRAARAMGPRPVPLRVSTAGPLPPRLGSLEDPPFSQASVRGGGRSPPDDDVCSLFGASRARGAKRKGSPSSVAPSPAGKSFQAVATDADACSLFGAKRARVSPKAAGGKATPSGGASFGGSAAPQAVAKRRGEHPKAATRGVDPCADMAADEVCSLFGATRGGVRKGPRAPVPAARPGGGRGEDGADLDAPQPARLPPGGPSGSPCAPVRAKRFWRGVEVEGGSFCAPISGGAGDGPPGQRDRWPRAPLLGWAGAGEGVRSQDRGGR